MSVEVRRVRTTPTTREWRDGVVAAADRLGISLSDAALSVLWAQWALETGRGKSCYCFNLGNIKAVTGDGRDWCVLQTFEFINGKRVDMADKFRAFPTLADGAYDYLQFLSRDNYALPWSFVLLGDADKFARALKTKGYFTADVEEYAHGLRSLAAEYLRDAQRDTLPAPAPDDTAKTVPDAPSPIRRASSMKMQAVNAPIIEGGAVVDADDGTAKNPVRADAGAKEYVP